MAWAFPDSDDFKSRFVRDFPYAPDSDPDNLDYVIDTDINNAITIAGASFNQGICSDESVLTEMALLLSAFFLVENLKVAQKGINSQAQFPVSSKSIGGVSVSYQLPELYSKDPYFSQFVNNGYGMQYLSLAMPYLVGGASTIFGRTTNV